MQQSFKEQFISIIYYYIGLLGYTWMMVGFFPLIESIKGVYLEQMPETFLKFFGGDMLSMTNFEGFISIEFLALFFILIVSFYVASSAGSIIAGAIEKKTMDFNLSQPFSRNSLVLSESLVTMLYTGLLVSLTTLSIFILCNLYKISISPNGLLAFALTATVFLWSIYGIAIFLSSILKSKITVAAVTVSLVMGFYVFTAMTAIVDKLKDFARFSLFYNYNPQKLLESGQPNWHQLEIWAIILLVGILGSLFIFNRKDV